MKLAAQLFLCMFAIVPFLALASFSLAGLFALFSIASLILAIYGSNHAIEHYDPKLIFFNGYKRISPWKLLSLGIRKHDYQLILGGAGHFLMVIFTLLAVASQ